MPLNPTDFITRNALESVTIRYANEQTDYIADYVFPPTPTNKSRVKVWQYDTANYNSTGVGSTRKTSKSIADRLDYSGFYTDRTLELHKFASEVDPQDERDFDKPIADLRAEAAMQIMDRLLIDKEREAVTLACTAANYPAGLTSTLSAGSTWAEAGGDPVADARTARNAVKSACGKFPNALAIGRATWEALKVSPVVLDRIKYTSAQTPTEELVKNLMQVDHLFISAAQYNTPASSTLLDIWDDEALFFVYDPSPRLKKVAYGMQPIVNRLYSYETLEELRGGPEGRITVLEMGWEYLLAPGAVVSSADTDFAAGYLLDNAS